MRAFFVNPLLFCLLFQGCKPVESNQIKVKASNATKPSANDDATEEKQGNSATMSPMDIMATDLRQALIKNAGLSTSDASSAISSAKSSVTNKSPLKLANQATEFLSGLLTMLQGNKLKIADQSKVMEVIGSATFDVLEKLYVSDAEKLKDSDVADFSDPAFIKLVSDVVSNAISRQSKNLSLEAVGPLLKGLVTSLPANTATSVQLSAVLGSLGSGVVIATGGSLESAELAKFVEEANKGLLAGAGSRKGIGSDALARQAQAVIQECLKAVGGLPNYDKNKLPDILKGAVKGAMSGSGSMSKYDSAAANTVAKSLIQGVVNAIKALNPLNYVSLADKIVSQGIAGVKEGVLEIPGLDPTTLDSLHIDSNEILAQLSSK